MTIGLLLLALVGVELIPMTFHRRAPRADVWKSRVPPIVRFLQNDRDLVSHRFNPAARALSQHVPAFRMAGISSLGVFNQPRTPSSSTPIIRQSSTADSFCPLLLPSKRPILESAEREVSRDLQPRTQKEAELEAAGLTASHDRRAIQGIPESHRVAAGICRPRFPVVKNRKIRYPRRGNRNTGRCHSGVLPGSPRAAGRRRVANRAVRAESPESDRQRFERRVLVLLDSYGDGWTATVNGAPAPIVR